MESDKTRTWGTEPTSLLDQMFMAQTNITTSSINKPFRDSTWSSSSLSFTANKQGVTRHGISQSKIHPFENNHSSATSQSGTNRLLSRKSTKNDERSKNTEQLKNKISPDCKMRVQGLMIGLLAAVIRTGVALALALTKPWENATTSLSSQTTTTTTTTTPKTCTSFRWNRTGIRVAGTNGNSTTPQGVSLPQSIYLDSNNTLYVADFGNNRIQQWFPNATVGITVAGITGLCISANLSTLCSPRSIYVDEQQNLYIGELRGIMIWRMGDSEGEFLNGSFGLNPWSNIEMDGDGNLYASTSSYSNAVLMWSSISATPIIIAGGNGTGLASSQLMNPVGFFIDSKTKTMYIANSQANTIVSWKMNETTGRLIVGQNNTAGSGLSSLRNPRDVRLDPYGNMYIADTGNFRVVMLCNNSLNTDFRIIIESGISSPQSLVFDPQLNIYVSDSTQNRVVRYDRVA